MLLGRSDEAISEGKRAVELEPLNLNNGANLSGWYFYGRQYDRALAEAKQVFDLDPNFIVGRWALSQAYIVKGMSAEAINHDYLLPRIKVEPFLDPLRDDVRFKEMLKRLNLPE